MKAKSMQRLCREMPVDPKLDHVYIVMKRWDTGGAFLVRMDGPVGDEMRAKYMAFVECPLDLASRHKLLSQEMCDFRTRLILPVLKHIESGHWNDDVIQSLVEICKFEHWDELSDSLKALPSRSGLGNEVSWSLAALRCYWPYWRAWYEQMHTLRTEAGAYALKALGRPVVVDPAIKTLTAAPSTSDPNKKGPSHDD